MCVISFFAVHTVLRPHLFCHSSRDGGKKNCSSRVRLPGAPPRDPRCAPSYHVYCRCQCICKPQVFPSGVMTLGFCVLHRLSVWCTRTAHNPFPLLRVWEKVTYFTNSISKIYSIKTAAVSRPHEPLVGPILERSRVGDGAYSSAGLQRKEAHDMFDTRHPCIIDDRVPYADNCPFKYG